MQTRLDLYDNSWYKPGGSSLKRLLWYFGNLIFFRSGFFPVNGLKCSLLRLFGAKVGKGVVIKPSVNIKYPWRLEIGDYVWIGEEVWIDNLADVKIGNHVCLSQGSMLLCGNHNYKKPGFDLMIGEIILEEGVWIAARALVGPGVRAHQHAMLAAGSVAAENLDSQTIYKGNPAVAIKKRSENGTAA